MTDNATAVAYQLPERNWAGTSWGSPSPGLAAGRWAGKRDKESSDKPPSGRCGSY